MLRLRLCFLFLFFFQVTMAFAVAPCDLRDLEKFRRLPIPTRLLRHYLSKELREYYVNPRTGKIDLREFLHQVSVENEVLFERLEQLSEGEMQRVINWMERELELRKATTILTRTPEHSPFWIQGTNKFRPRPLRWESLLSSEEAEALRDYLSYGYINDYLRGLSNTELKSMSKSEINHKVALLKTALGKLEAQPGPSFRGIVVPNNSGLLRSLVEGSDLVDPAFVSASTNHNIAFRDFAQIDSDEVDITKETRILFKIDGRSGRLVPGNLKRNESEIIFLPNTKFRVDRVQIKEGIYYVELSEEGLETLGPKTPSFRGSPRTHEGTLYRHNWMLDEDGREWLFKSDTIHPELQSAAEVISARIYKRLGYVTPEVKIVNHQGKRFAAISSLGRGMELTTLEDFSSYEMKKLRIVAAFLKDWDRLEIGPNNFRLSTKDFALFDFGGTLGSRAMGKHKEGKVFSPAVGSFSADKTFKDLIESFNMDNLGPKHPWRDFSASDAEMVKKEFETLLDDDFIEESVRAAQYSNPADSAYMISTLKVQRDLIISQITSYFR